MNDALVPALIAAGGGSVMLAGIWWHERAQIAAARRDRVRLRLRFPVGLEPSQALAALDGLAGLPYTSELIAEVVAGEDSIAHFLWVPESVRASVQSTMTGVIPSLGITEAHASPDDAATLALRWSIPTPCVLSAENAVAVSRALLSGMVGLRRSEQVILRIALRPGSARSWQEPENPSEREREVAKQWRRKTSLPGFTAAALLLIRTSKMDRARELGSHIESTLRSRRQIGGVRVTRERGNHSLSSTPRTTRSAGWMSTPELLATAIGWPLGAEVAVPGVEVGAARSLPVPSGVPRRGRRICVGRDGSGTERPVALDADAARLHMAVVAPTGGGKSNLLMRCILDDLAGGYGGVLLDPKNDLVSDLLDRIPPEHADRIVVLDPAASGPVPGLDLLGSGDPDVRSDVVLSALKGIYRDAWGVRIDGYLRLGLRTLIELQNPVISDWMRLYAEPDLRRAAVARIQDNPILAAQWRVYEESLSAAEQFQHIAPALSRITSLLARPALRNIINQPQPKLSIPRLLAERKWLLVALSPTLGESANDLLSAIVGYLVWTAIEQRVSLPASQRRPVFFYCDELHSLHLPVGLEVFLERSRGLGCGVVAASQGLARLNDSVRSSLLGNVGSLVAMKATGHDEAVRLARELPGLEASDVLGLRRFECAVRVNSGGPGGGTAIITGRTEGPPPVTGQAASIRARSAERYGTDPAEIEAELRRRVQGDPTEATGTYGRTGEAGVTRPVAPPIASSASAQHTRPGLASRDISPPKQSVPARSNYITADRLYRTLHQMTDTDWLVLGFLGDCRLASGSQLIRRYWQTADRNDGRARAGRRALKRLSDRRVLDALPRRVGGERAGSSGIVYTVGVAGAKLLARRGAQASRLEAPGALYVAHTLAATEMVVRLDEADRSASLEVIEVQTEPACWRSFLAGIGARLTLKPDLFIRVTAPGSGYEDRWFVEVDLATEATGTILAKAKRYLAHHRAGTEQVHPRVLWTVPDARRSAQIESALERLPAQARRMFSVSRFEEAVAFLATEARS